MTADYDALDRLIRTTYPDGTYDQQTYHRLDVAESRDRRGRITRYLYDAHRRLISMRDPSGSTITQQWCACGSLDALIDGKGQKTSWQWDIQGRKTREMRADGVTETVYAYEATTSRLATVTDPKLQVVTYSYNADGTTQSMTYTNATIATPAVSFTYDSAYNRQVTMVDGTGTTNFTYHPVGMLGAGQMACADGPLTNDVITYVYDELGRITTRAVNGVGPTKTYDTLGRMSTETNVLGTLTFGYENVSNRLASVAYPNGQSSAYTYFGNTMDRRLQTAHHKRPNLSTLSKHDYTYDTVGNILSWEQQADSSLPETSRYGYDRDDQLLPAVISVTGSPTSLSRYAYTYDAAGNRTSQQIDDVIVLSTYDALNRLTGKTPGGPLRFAGTVNEPATVSIQGKPAVVDAANGFSGDAVTVAGTNGVTIQAVDGSGNVASRRYSVPVSGASSTLSYDAKGNVVSDGGTTFEWDVRDQLVAIVTGLLRTEFTYDGLKRRVRIVEKDNGVIQSDTRFVWCNLEIPLFHCHLGRVLVRLGREDEGERSFKDGALSGCQQLSG